jgi:Uma2 family endonuclease
VSWALPEQYDAPGKYCQGPPNLAIEVVSEFDRARELQMKVEEYLASGCPEVWVLYPDSRSVVVTTQRGVTTHRGMLRSDLMPGLELDLNQLLAGL